MTGLRHRFRSFFARAGNSTWATLEYLAYPVLMLLATPLFVARLGAEGYGLWMFVNALAGFASVAGLGMAAAAIRFVSARHAVGDGEGSAAALRQCLLIALAGAGAVALLLVAVASPLAAGAFAAMGETAEVAAALRWGALILVLMQCDAVLGAGLKGLERFDLAARLEIGVRFGAVAATLAAAFLTGDTRAVLATFAACVALGLFAKAATLRGALGGRRLLPGPGDRPGRELLAYGFWNWLQGFASAMFQHLDRLLIGGFLGAAPVAVYTVCAQLAQLIQNVPAAALSVLLPAASRRQARGADTQALCRLAIAANAALTLAFALPLAVLGEFVLRLWMGAGFAAQGAPVLALLVIAYAMISLSIAPHYLLLGRGEARFVSFTSLLGGVASLAVSVTLVPTLGIIGAAIGRMAYAPPLYLNFAVLLRGRAAGGGR